MGKQEETPIQGEVRSSKLLPGTAGGCEQR